MKTKNVCKKLRLSKKTIVNLDNWEIEKVYGGADETTVATGPIMTCGIPLCITKSGVPCIGC